MSNRKQRDKNRETAASLRRIVTKGVICGNCGQPGSHFVPPGFGSPGSYACKEVPHLAAFPSRV